MYFSVCYGNDDVEIGNAIISSLPKYPWARYTNDSIAWFPRIIGGTNAPSGEFPGIVIKYDLNCENSKLFYNIIIQVSLQTRRGSHLCGATLITWEILITAAHCVTDELTGEANDINRVL